MIISDLNVLKAVEGSAVVGGLLAKSPFTFKKNIDIKENTNIDFNVDTKVTDTFLKLALIDVKSNVKGNSADITFSNEAVGPDTSTEAAFQQLTIAGAYSGQSGTIVSAAN